MGRFGVELAARSGAEVTAVAAGPGRGAGLEDIGASEIVDDPSHATGKFDLILESAGGESLATMPRLLAREGVLVVFGNSSGEPNTVSFGDFMESPDARLEILRVYESWDPAGKGDDLALLVSFVSRGWLHPMVGYETDLDNAGAALGAVAARTVPGKAVIRFDGEGSG